MPHAIPSDWHDVVHRVSAWLEDATSRLDRHESDFTLRFPTPENPPATGNKDFADRLSALPRKLEPIDALGQDADAAAHEAEGVLRDLARRSETLRLRLADWVGRAIR